MHGLYEMPKRARPTRGNALKAQIISPIDGESHLPKRLLTEENPMSDVKANSTSIQVLSRMFSLLDTLAHAGDSVSLKFVSEQTGLHPSTAHRILNDLAVGGLVERSGPGAYRLGLRLLELGNLVRSRLDLRELAVRPMQELHRLTGYPVSLFIRQDDEALCIERTVSERNGVQVTRVMGLRVPLTSGAAGKILLLNENGSTLQSLTANAGLRPDSLHAELSHIRQAGLALDGEGQDPTAQLAAAPIWDDQGRVTASLALNAPASRMSPEWSEALKGTANRVSASLGWVHA
jgi:IclR family transcriptional regulator, carbohydrate utilization repressor